MSYPLSEALGLKLVSELPDGFDIDHVEAKLGAKRFAALYPAKVNTVFSSSHRRWPADHPEAHKRNAEVHCIYAQDVENFLKGAK